MAGARILYVDDDEWNRVLVRRILSAANYEMYEAETGAQGLNMAQELQPDLILMDINLPDIDGYECTRRIREMPDISQTPIIALTANAMVGDREKALAAGTDGYISKPIEVDKLVDQVAEYLRASPSLEAGPSMAGPADAPTAEAEQPAPDTPQPEKKPKKDKRSILGRAKAKREAANKDGGG